MSNADNTPLFTLTAEEVELVRQALLTEKNVVIDIHCKFPAVDSYIIPTRDKINNLLTRIKQFQKNEKNETLDCKR